MKRKARRVVRMWNNGPRKRRANEKEPAMSMPETSKIVAEERSAFPPPVVWKSLKTSSKHPESLVLHPSFPFLEYQPRYPDSRKFNVKTSKRLGTQIPIPCRPWQSDASRGGGGRPLSRTHLPLPLRVPLSRIHSPIGLMPRIQQQLHHNLRARHFRVRHANLDRAL